MARRYRSGHTGHKRKTHPKIRISTHKTRKRRLQGEQEKVKILLKSDSLAGTHYCPGWNKTEQRKDGSHKQTKPTNQHKNTQIIFGGDPIPSKIHSKLFQKKTDNMRQLLKKNTK